MTTREEKIQERRMKLITENILTDKNIIFTHIPKNGGRMVRLNLWSKITESGFRPNHFHPNFVNSYEQWKDVNNFVFVRNPYTRLASCYYFFFPRAYKRMIQKRPLYSKVAKYSTFTEFVDALPKLSIAPTWSLDRHKNSQYDLGFFFGKQVNWLNEKTVFIGKKENLLEDINRLADFIERPDLKIDKLRSRKAFVTTRHENFDIPYMDLYDKHMIKIVNEIYEEDFIKFGYEML